MLAAAQQQDLAGRAGVPCGVARQARGHSNYKALQVHLQGLSWGSVLGSDTLVFPVPNTEPGSEQGLIKYLMR